VWECLLRTLVADQNIRLCLATSYLLRVNEYASYVPTLYSVKYTERNKRLRLYSINLTTTYTGYVGKMQEILNQSEKVRRNETDKNGAE